jgi:NAD(P)-dependent dehydrogenase (short-subunit alcohol dehydrogenase family)
MPTVLLTGSSRGSGRATAEAPQARGVAVIEASGASHVR